MTDVENKEVVEETKEPTQEVVNLNDMVIAYTVGLKPDGNFFFQVSGQNQGLVELMGIHQYASKRMDVLIDQRSGTGDALTMELGKGLQLILDKVNQLVNVVAPKPPDNKL